MKKIATLAAATLALTALVGCTPTAGIAAQLEACQRAVSAQQEAQIAAAEHLMLPQSEVIAILLEQMDDLVTYGAFGIDLAEVSRAADIIEDVTVTAAELGDSAAAIQPDIEECLG